MSGNVPTEIHFVQIADDGVYDQLEFAPIPDTVGMEMRSRTRGRIDLATGKERMDEQAPRSLAVSVSWKVEDGLLWRRTETGNAGDGVSFTRELR